MIKPGITSGLWWVLPKEFIVSIAAIAGLMIGGFMTSAFSFLTL